MSERIYIYPDYSIFPKEFDNTIKSEKVTHTLLERFVVDAVLAQTDKKPVDLLNADEKIGICIGAGIPLKFQDGKLSSSYDVKIAQVEGLYKVSYNLADIPTHC